MPNRTRGSVPRHQNEFAQGLAAGILLSCIVIVLVGIGIVIGTNL